MRARLKERGALRQFGEHVLNLSTRVIKGFERDKAHQKEFEEALGNVLHDVPGPRHARPLLQSP